MNMHLYEDFFHNGRPCGTTEATSIREAIRLHTTRGWVIKACHRHRIDGRSLYFAAFHNADDTETSGLRFRFA